MSKTSGCPEVDALDRYAAGVLSEDERVRLASHVDSCPSCSRLLSDVAANLELASLLAAGDLDSARPAEPTPPSPEAAELLERVTSLPGQASRYEIGEEIARGGMGAILRAFDPGLRRDVAMKVALAKDVDGPGGVSRRSLARFLEEAQVTGQLEHPGIVPVHELGVDQAGRVYFTMQLVQGRELREVFTLVREGGEGWSLTRALTVLLRVCEAMAFAHDKGVVHRDLKPSNVMVGRFGEVYVMDWGLARVLGTDDRRDIRPRRGDAERELTTVRREEGESDPPILTMDGAVLGTPTYMSPEQAQGRAELVDRRSDVYSIGSMLYELLTGRRPYAPSGERPSARAVLDALADGPPTPVSELTRTCPPELVAICEKSMARQREARYADTSELAEDLRSFLEHRVVAAYEAGALAELRKWVKRNQPLAASLAAGLVLLVAGLATSLVLRAQAVESGKVASARAEDVLSLSAFQALDDLRRRADALWPPYPENLRAYDEWIGAAAELCSGLDPDPSGDDVGHRARLAALRERALPATEEARLATLQPHPRFKEVAALEGAIAALRDAEEVRAGRAEVPEVSLDTDALPEQPDVLMELAWPLVNPQRTRFGEEARGLALARLAAERVEDDGAYARCCELLAWALLANGADGEALEAMEEALAVSSGARRFEFERIRDQLAAALEEGRATRIADLEVELAGLEADPAGPSAWRFADEQDRWWHNQLTKLVSELDAFADPETGLWKGSSPELGWGIERRRDFALEMERRAEDEAPKWQAARERVAANPRYGGMRLASQLGLVPLGPDPGSGLEEFGHPLSGDVPTRGADGRLERTESMGLVFVLLPAGEFWMGAQANHPDGQNYDAQAGVGEGPVHLVALSAFFLSKYELTQGQWERFTLGNPSNSGPGVYLELWNRERRPWSPLLPVEGVSWDLTTAVLGRMGLVLPTEAQWEYGARSGTSSVYWCGDAPESLQDAANLADAFSKANGNYRWSSWEPWLDDGNSVYAVVGSYRANAFGLHDMNGNVWEWCLDGFEIDFYGKSPTRNPLCDPAGHLNRVNRGGCYASMAVDARSSSRNGNAAAFVNNTIGLRPARLLEP